MIGERWKEPSRRFPVVLIPREKETSTKPVGLGRTLGKRFRDGRFSNTSNPVKDINRWAWAFTFYPGIYIPQKFLASAFKTRCASSRLKRVIRGGRYCIESFRAQVLL